MKAMVLAAGLGTRLRPLTDTRPKALVELNGRTLLEIALERLRSFGVQQVVINAHHFAEMLVEYLGAHGDFGMEIELSLEAELLDTGGGLKKAAGFFLRDGRNEPFLVHNVDVLSTIDLGALLRAHAEHNALATLAVQRRLGSRQLLFDAAGELCGRHTRGAEPEMVRRASATGSAAIPGQAESCEELAFCGVHVLSPAIFSRMDSATAFPIIGTYLRLAGEGEAIRSFRADGCYWRDLGTEASLRQAESELASGAIR
jgi:NDP-sugar pyrophosphorylase family protein